DQLVLARPELLAFEQRRIAAAVGVGDDFLELFVRIAAHPIERDLQPLGRAAAGSIEHMGREPCSPSHRSSFGASGIAARGFTILYCIGKHRPAESGQNTFKLSMGNGRPVLNYS